MLAAKQDKDKIVVEVDWRQERMHGKTELIACATATAISFTGSGAVEGMLGTKICGFRFWEPSCEEEPRAGNV